MENLHEFFKKRLGLKKEILEKEGKSYNQIQKEKQNLEISEIDALIGDTDPAVSSVASMYEKTEDTIDISEMRKSINQETQQAEQFDQVFQEIKTLTEKLSLINKKRFQLQKKNTGTVADDAQFKNLDIAEKLIVEQLDNLHTNKETARLARMAELVRYQQGFTQGYIETPSRAQSKHQIADLLVQGEHIFLEGDSGTGKTQLLRHLVKDLEGYEPDVVVSSDQIKLNELLGRDKLETENGATVTVFKEGMLVRAMTQGKKIIFDEFNNMDSNVRFGLKPFYTLKPGDTFRLQQDGEKEFTVKEGFGFLATGNLPSKKHPERKPLDPAETREFKMPHLDHMPKEEIYDMLLVASMRQDGSVPLSKEEAENTLATLASAITNVHDAYEGNGLFYKDAVKKTKAVLEKAVLDPKEYLSWVSAYKHQTKLSFLEFIQQKISFFITKGDFPDTDKNLLFKIFATKGLLHGVDLSQFVVDATEAESLGWKQIKETTSSTVRNLSLYEIANVDPFHTRQIQENTAIEEFIKNNQSAESKEILDQFKNQHSMPTPEQIQQFTAEYDTFWKDTYKTWESSRDTSQMQFTPEFKLPTEINFKDLAEQPDDTKEFGKYLTNPETALLDYESLGEPIIFNPNTDAGYQSWLQQQGREKGVASVMDYVHETYAGDHHIPGIEYQKYLFENQEKIPASLKDGNWYYFPGSAFRSSDGGWVSPCGYWLSGEWGRDGSDVGRGWSSVERVVLFGK